MNDQTFEQDPDLAAQLRQGAGREWAEEAAEDERMTALHDRRRFTLAEMAKEMVNRGDRASVDFAGHNFSGAVVGAGTDYVTLEGSGLRAEIRLDAGYWSILPTDLKAPPGVAVDETIVARLAEHADQGTMVRVAIPGGGLVIGKVTVVSSDHVEMADADDRRLFVPIGLILAVTRSIDFQ